MDSKTAEEIYELYGNFDSDKIKDELDSKCTSGTSSRCEEIMKKIQTSCEVLKFRDCFKRISPGVIKHCSEKDSSICSWLSPTRPAETTTTSSNSTTIIIIGCVIGGVVLLVVAVGIYILCRKRLKKKGEATGTSATTGISGATGVSGTTATTGTTTKKTTRSSCIGTGSSAV